MAKYYVQSGTMRSVVQAASSRKAALWAIHQVLGQVLPLNSDADAAGNDPVQEVTMLSAKVAVSERGFDRDDASSLLTMDVVTEWNQMVMTLDRLERMLYRAE